MADEKKNIIFSIQIDQSKSIQQIIAFEDEIKGLKNEQKQLNLATEEGRKANIAYNA